MIKFFRHIRIRLLSENPPASREGKFSRYLIYAIGEIILVVLGILIALQINNWNELRKLQNEELKLLLEVKSNLETTLANFKNDSQKNSQYIHGYNNIKYYIEEDLIYNTELDSAFGRLKSWSSPYPIYTAYTTLKTKGLDIISNESLRRKIANMFEFEFTRLSTDYDKAEWILYQEVIIPFYSKHLRIYRKNSMTLARPNDFEYLKHNDEFLNLLELVINERKSGLKMYNKIMLDISYLIGDIEKELNSRK